MEPDELRKCLLDRLSRETVAKFDGLLTDAVFTEGFVLGYQEGLRRASGLIEDILSPQT